MEDLPRRNYSTEVMVRGKVRDDVAGAMTETTLRIAMRSHTPDSFRQSMLRDGASALAISTRLA